MMPAWDAVAECKLLPCDIDESAKPDWNVLFRLMGEDHSSEAVQSVFALPFYHCTGPRMSIPYLTCFHIFACGSFFDLNLTSISLLSHSDHTTSCSPFHTLTPPHKDYPSLDDQ